MALGGCLTCVKYLLFIFNFLFWLTGCVLLGMGIWFVVDQKSSSDLKFLEGISIGGYGLIVIGSIIMVVGFFGCCGAIRESQCLLITFFICLFIIFGVMLGVGIFYIVKQGESEDLIRKSYKELAEKYSDTSEEAKPLKEQLNNLHKQFKCCGYQSGAADFTSPTPEGCNPDPGRLCHKAIAESIKSGHLILAGIGLGISVVLLLGMIFSLMLCCAIRDSV